MSRTHAHRPHKAHLCIPGHCVAVHDHRRHGCDLPELDEFFAVVRATGSWWTQPTSCWWDIDPYAIAPNCGCAMCTAQRERRAARRLARRIRRNTPRRGAASTLAAAYLDGGYETPRRIGW